MTINCIKERVRILEHLWDRYHNKKHCDILLQQLNNDICLFLGVKLPEDLEKQISDLEKEIHE
mgnify:CR=1 FL=1